MAIVVHKFSPHSKNVTTTAETTALSPRGRPRYLLQLRDSSHCLLRNSKEAHFLLF